MATVCKTVRRKTYAGSNPAPTTRAASDHVCGTIKGTLTAPTTRVRLVASPCVRSPTAEDVLALTDWLLRRLGYRPVILRRRNGQALLVGNAEKASDREIFVHLWPVKGVIARD